MYDWLAFLGDCERVGLGGAGAEATVAGANDVVDTNAGVLVDVDGADMDNASCARTCESGMAPMSSSY